MVTMKIIYSDGGFSAEIETFGLESLLPEGRAKVAEARAMDVIRVIEQAKAMKKNQRLPPGVRRVEP